MKPRVLLDTHILTGWLAERRTISRAQLKVLEQAQDQGQSVAISAITINEIAYLATDLRDKASRVTGQMLDVIEDHPLIEILPITIAIGREVMALRHVLRDPGDCTIVATARVHGLRLLTQDERIIESKLVTVVD